MKAQGHWLRSALWYFTSNLAARGSTMINLVALSWLLPADQFGQYGVIVGLSFLVFIVGASWVSTSVAKIFATSQGLDVDKSWTSIAQAGLIGSLTIGLVVISALHFSFVATREQSLLLLGLSLSTFVCEIVLACANGLDRPRVFALASMLRGMVGMICSVALVLLGQGLVGALLGLMVGNVLAVAIVAQYLPFQRIHVFSKPTALIGEMLSFGVPAASVFGFYFLIHAINRYTIAERFGDAQAGVYSFSFDLLFAPLGAVASAINLAVLADLYGAGQFPGPKIFDQTNRNFLARTLLLVVPYAGGGFILAPHLITAIAPPEMRYEVSQIAGLAAIHVASLILTSSIAFMFLAQQRKVVVLSLIATTLVVNGLTVELSDQPDITGIARALTFGILFSTILSAVFCATQMKNMFPWKEAIAACTAGAVMTGILWLLPITSFLLLKSIYVALGLLIYVSCLVGLGILEPKYFANWFSFLRRLLNNKAR
jgi:O-antigen/teichoic acid export membrane protein